MESQSSAPVEPLTPTKSNDEARVTSADLVCNERMPTPDAMLCPSSPSPSPQASPPAPLEVFRIPVQYPWKRTYCGSELIYDPDMYDAEIMMPEQSLDPSAAGVAKQAEDPVTPEPTDEDQSGAPIVKAVWCAAPEDDAREQSCLYSPTAKRMISYSPVAARSVSEALEIERNEMARTGSDSPKIGRTGSDSPKMAPVGSDSPKMAPVGSDSPKMAPVGSDSPKIGRTGSDSPKMAPVGSDADARTFTMNVPVKLEPFSPPRAKAGVREDSEPAQEPAIKRVRFETEPPESCAA